MPAAPPSAHKQHSVAATLPGHIRPEEAVKLAQGHDMAINTKDVLIVSKNEAIFGEKDNLLSELTHSIEMDVYPVFILRAASQRQLLMMESCAGRRKVGGEI
ncbi:hypothetical protein [Xenorhabdus sp. IM139775]|uniref:hypothetical protein n=1 Tax=Xenorhabdus sp. IM139775 TaxID=3025876 RepID=UPI0023585444|nr:hypothetical protein [Xenorhabdus sp. IM139775]MDC9594723.1 hypothetical protein [Xenorhabdus sp. IM139775]